jgi:hypothetical protein
MFRRQTTNEIFTLSWQESYTSRKAVEIPCETGAWAMIPNLPACRAPEENAGIDKSESIFLHSRFNFLVCWLKIGPVEKILKRSLDRRVT